MSAPRASTRPLTDTIGLYLDHLRHIRRLSPHTCTGYEHDLGVAADFFAARERLDWTDVAPADVRELLAARHRSGASPTTLARLASALRSFYTWQMRQGLASNNPATDVRAPKKPARLPATLDVDDISNMLDAQPADTLEIRDHALLELFYSAGIRLAEAHALDVAHLDLAS